MNRRQLLSVFAVAAALLRPAPDELLHFWPVSKAVNSPLNNGPELLAEHASAPTEGGPNPA